MNKELEMLQEKINKYLIEITSFAWNAKKYSYAEDCILLKRRLNKLIDNRRKENINTKYIKKISDYIDSLYKTNKELDKKYNMLYEYFNICIYDLLEILY